jgi:hypothetical protein
VIPIKCVPATWRYRTIVVILSLSWAVSFLPTLISNAYSENRSEGPTTQSTPSSDSPSVSRSPLYAVVSSTSIPRKKRMRISNT